MFRHFCRFTTVFRQTRILPTNIAVHQRCSALYATYTNNYSNNGNIPKLSEEDTEKLLEIKVQVRKLNQSICLNGVT